MTACMRTALLQLSRLSIAGTSLHGNQAVRSFSAQTTPLAFRATDSLWAEPMKKKKKMDVAEINARELKRKRKLEKEIKKLERKGRTLKPVEEIEGYLDVIKTRDQRIRPPVMISNEEEASRALLKKKWTRYKVMQHHTEMRQINAAIRLQQRALAELRSESEELYQQAIQVREDLLPYERKGPLSTPPIKDYFPPDGEYTDTTKVFDK